MRCNVVLYLMFPSGTGIWCNVDIDGCCWFFKLPHKDGASYNVGNPLAKDFLNKFSENVLAGDTESAEEILTIARKLSYWRNNRDRILDQMIVWLPQESLPPGLGEGTCRWPIRLSLFFHCPLMQDARSALLFPRWSYAVL